MWSGSNRSPRLSSASRLSMLLGFTVLMLLIWEMVFLCVFQVQIHEVQEFQRVVTSYKPEVELLSELATQAQSSGEKEPVCSKMAGIQQNYDRLKMLVAERQDMLESFMPSVQQYNSSRGAWEDLLCGWEEKAAALPPPGATPESVQEQIDDVKV